MPIKAAGKLLEDLDASPFGLQAEGRLNLACFCKPAKSDKKKDTRAAAVRDAGAQCESPGAR